MRTDWQRRRTCWMKGKGEWTLFLSWLFSASTHPRGYKEDFLCVVKIDWNGWLWLLWGYFCPRLFTDYKRNLKGFSKGKQNCFCSENAETASFRDLLDYVTKVSPQSETLVKAVIQQPALHFSRLKFSSVKCFHLSLTRCAESRQWWYLIPIAALGGCGGAAPINADRYIRTASEKGKGGGFITIISTQQQGGISLRQHDVFYLFNIIHYRKVIPNCAI